MEPTNSVIASAATQSSLGQGMSHLPSVWIAMAACAASR